MIDSIGSSCSALTLSGWKYLPFGLLLTGFIVTGCANRPSSSSSQPGHGSLRFEAAMLEVPQGKTGPSLILSIPNSHVATNSIENFMYFVPLVSPTEVHPHRSTNNTQEVILRVPANVVSSDRFSVTCGIEIRGEGHLRHVIDHRVNMERNAARLRSGGVLERQLDEITIEGAGRGDIRVAGIITNQTAQVLEVELRFSGHGQPSPVTIGLVDLHEVDGVLRRRNEQVARVQSLAFRASTGSVARMHVHVGSVMAKDAGGGWWQRMGGAVTGFAANLFLKPIRVDPVGHATMLRLGANLAAGRHSFTFPPAKALSESRPRTAP